MCLKIQCDEKSWKIFGYGGELNKALMVKFLGTSTTENNVGSFVHVLCNEIQSMTKNNLSHTAIAEEKDDRSLQHRAWTGPCGTIPKTVL